MRFLWQAATMRYCCFLTCCIFSLVTILSHAKLSTHLPVQVCKNGKCVVDNENIIPDYTHVTRSIANRIDKPASKSTTSRPVSAVVSKPQNRFNRRQPRPQVYSRNSDSQPKHDPPSTSTSKTPIIKECEDAVERLAGGLTCTEFLERYGDRYCRHNYMTRNCCRSHQIVCANR